MDNLPQNGITVPYDGDWYYRGFIDIMDAQPGQRYKLAMRINGKRNSRCLVASSSGASDNRVEVVFASFTSLKKGEVVTLVLYSAAGTSTLNMLAENPYLWPSLALYAR